MAAGPNARLASSVSKRPSHSRSDGYRSVFVGEVPVAIQERQYLGLDCSMENVMVYWSQNDVFQTPRGLNISILE